MPPRSRRCPSSSAKPFQPDRPEICPSYSFFTYLSDRLGLNTTGSQVPSLAHLVASPA
jgi:hypothetical protein